MKKLFTLIAAALTIVSAQAKDYTTQLAVNIDGFAVPSKPVTVSIDEQADGNYTLTLKNFSVYTGMDVGTIVVEDVEGIVCGNTTVIESSQFIQIAAGDVASETGWLGPALGDVPITLLGELKGDNVKAVLNISFNSMSIGVKLGEDTESLAQLPNSGFNQFHTASYKPAIGSKKTSNEPNGWHSFMSATGSLVAAVAGTPHTFIAEEGAPNSTDNKSVQIKSAVVYGASANGTITTGRLQAGNISATSTQNCSFSNLSSTDLDANGDPFYAVLTAKPDSIKAWVKLHNGPRTSTYADYIYATISAIINDGTNVQDPEVDDYSSSVIARAKFAEIGSNDEQWQEVTIPFEYTGSDAQPKSILVTMSTCAYAGGGSRDNDDPDILTVDSVALVYNYSIASLAYNDTPVTILEDNTGEIDVNGEFSWDNISMTLDAEGAYYSYQVMQQEDYDDDGNPITLNYLTVTITSGDLKNAKTYAFLLNNADVSGIQKANADAGKSANAPEYYNAAGQRISSLQPGLNIVRQGNKVVKMIKK